MTKSGCESKSIYPVDKLGKSPSPLPVFHLLPTFPHLNHLRRVFFTTFICRRVSGAQHQKNRMITTSSHARCFSRSASHQLRDAPGFSQTTSHHHPIQTTPPSCSLPPSGGMSCPLPPSPGLIMSQGSRTWGQLSPDIFSGCLAVPFDSRTLIFVVQPSRSLAGPVAVVRKLALAAAVEPLLPFEAGVTDDVCQAGRTEGRVGSYLSEGQFHPVRVLPALHSWAPHIH